MHKANSSEYVDNLEIRTHPKFIEIKETFEKLFRNKSYFSDKKFDKDVWFMQTDIVFQNLISNLCTETCESNRMHSLLRELSENEELKKMSVETEKFIEKICIILFQAQKMVNRAKEIIKEYNAHEVVNVLEIKYKMLNEELRDQKHSVTKLDVSILRLDMFPEGKFRFDFHYIEKNPKDLTTTMSRNKNLKDNQLLNIKQGGEILILNKSESEVNSFEQISFVAIDSDQNQIMENFEHSGTSLSTFNVRIYKNEEPFAETTPEYFLNMFLLLIDKLRDTDKSSISTTWKLKANLNSNHEKNSIFNKEYEFVLEFKFDLDAITRASIINRILYILRDAIRTETINENIKNEILDVYFKPISEQIKFILNKSDEEREETMCACNSVCQIY